MPRPQTPLAFRFLNLVIRLAIVVTRTRLVVEGVEQLPDRPGVIVASNHLSIADPPLICLAIWRAAGRRVRYMAKAEAMETPIMGPALRAYGGFGVRRGQADRDAYRMSRAVLEGGDWLGLAPEGTRSRTAVLGEPMPGVVLLAVRSGAPILPVGIAGSERTWPVGGRRPRFGTTVTIRFGPPIDLWATHGQPDPTPEGQGGRTANRDRRAALDASTDTMMRSIAALLPPAYRGRFG
ncbi:MAG: lysophospholipid acyltransferase family protein [Candidatus Limnocylindrales bacterium]